MSIFIPTEFLLTPDSVVLDLGAYKGIWSREIVSRYGCRVHAFEPVFSYYYDLTALAAAHPLIVPFHFGLAPRSESVTINIAGDGSSIYTPKSGPTEEIRLISIEDFFLSRHVNSIDLMKINIEGAEFDLLEHLFVTPRLALGIRVFLIQFHSFMPDAAGRHERLLELASPLYEISGTPWTWEIWTRK